MRRIHWWRYSWIFSCCTSCTCCSWFHGYPSMDSVAWQPRGSCHVSDSLSRLTISPPEPLRRKLLLSMSGAMLPIFQQQLWAKWEFYQPRTNQVLIEPTWQNALAAVSEEYKHGGNKTARLIIMGQGVTITCQANQPSGSRLARLGGQAPRTPGVPPPSWSLAIPGFNTISHRA